MSVGDGPHEQKTIRGRSDDQLVFTKSKAAIGKPARSLATD